MLNPRFLLLIVFCYSSLASFSQENNPEELIKQARTFNNSNNYKRAIENCNRALAIDANNAAAYDTRGFAYYKMRDDEKAIKDYSRSIELAAGSFMVYYHRANSYKRSRDYERAINDYNKTLELNPQYSYAYNFRGLAYFYKDDYEQAIKDCSKSIELTPKNTLAYNNRGIAYYAKGDYEQAIKDYRKALNLEPLNRFALLNILPCLIRLDSFDVAAATYDTYKTNRVKGYIEFKTWQYYKSYLTAATYYVNKMQFNEALAELKTAESGYTSNNAEDKESDDFATIKGYTDILALKGYVLEKMDLINEAKITYSKALILNANQSDVKGRLSALVKRQHLAVKSDRTPPKIELATPTPSSTLTVLSDKNTTEIVGWARDISGIASLTINGKKIDNVEDDGLFNTTMKVIEGLNKIIIVSIDKVGNKASSEITITCRIIKRAGLTDTPVVNRREPKYYAVLIAATDYADKNAFPTLDNPVQDALKLKQILESSYSFKSANIDTLFNINREDILTTLTKRCNLLGEDDNLLIFFAGHGTAKKFEGEVNGYLIPVSARRNIYGTYISTADLATIISDSPGKHILLIADACFSGSMLRSIRAGVDDDMSQFVKQKNRVKSRNVMASGNLEPVPDNSVFMYHMLEELRSNKQKFILGDQLFSSFKKEVQENSGNSPQYGSFKHAGDEGGDFLFIRSEKTVAPVKFSNKGSDGNLKNSKK